MNSDLRGQLALPGHGEQLTVRLVDNGTAVQRVGPVSGAPASAFARAAAADFGPDLVSPFRRDSLGQWLAAMEAARVEAGHWLVFDAKGAAYEVELHDGVVLISAREAVSQDRRSRFRHDAMSLLNAIGMNVDLARLLAEKEGIGSIMTATDRIRSSAASLALLITEHGGSGSRDSEPLLPMLGRALGQLGIRQQLIGGHGSPRASADYAAPRASAEYAAAVAGLMTEWLLWSAPAIRNADPVRPAGDAGLRLESCDGAVVLSFEGPRSGPSKGVFRPLGAAAFSAGMPQFPAGPAATLDAMGVGYGSWTSARGAGIAAGLPRSADRLQAGG